MLQSLRKTSIQQPPQSTPAEPAQGRSLTKWAMQQLSFKFNKKKFRFSKISREQQSTSSSQSQYEMILSTLPGLSH
jgi:hypothetical protein